MQNLGSMIDNLNLCGKVLLKFGAGWQVYMRLSALWNLGAVVDNKIHLEYGILLEINKEPENKQINLKNHERDAMTLREI